MVKFTIVLESNGAVGLVECSLKLDQYTHEVYIQSSYQYILLMSIEIYQQNLAAFRRMSSWVTVKK